MNKYQFRKYLLQVHKADRRNFELKPEHGELVITEDFKIVIPKDGGRVMKNAARDLCEYLFVSMGVGVSVVCREEPDLTAPNCIILCSAEQTGIKLMDANSYIGDREHIEIKIKQTELMLKNELADYELI